MIFGTKKIDEKPMDDGDYIKYFKEEETPLRFLEELSDWTSVWMHFSNSKNRDYACTDARDTCPGHNSPDDREKKAAKRYIVNALSPDTGFVNLWKIPFSLIEDLMRQEAKDGTITARTYTVLKRKSSTGQTSYSLDWDDKDQMDLAPYREHMKDHQGALANGFREAWGGLPGEDGYSAEHELYSDDSPPPAWAKAAQEPVQDSAVKIAKAVFNPYKVDSTIMGRPANGQDTPPPSEPAAAGDASEQEISESQLRSMTEQEVIKVYELAGVNVPPSYTNTNDLVDNLIAVLS